MEFLIVIEPASGGRYEHRVAPGSYVLGREEASCDIAILSPEVSRQHARIHLSAEQCTVEDLGSTAGTSKDGQALDAKQSFPFPTEVMLGTTKLTVSVDEAVEMTFDSGSIGTPTANPSSAISFNQGQPDAPPATTEAGHYTKGREIARGGMGAILEANDRMLGRTVAMKVVLEERASEDARMRFIREATVLGQLEHPNIIPIHELGKDDDGNFFYAMKMVEGRTLQAIINDLKKGDRKTVDEFHLDRLLTVFRKVCDAIAFAHSKGIVHRDLKPENVMVGAFGEVLVMDWGLAKILNDAAQTADELGQQQHHLSNSNPLVSESALPTGFQELTDSQMRGSSEELTMDGAVMGSPQYMPPEQAEGRIADIDEKSDIYSLGGILYAILTLRPPIKGKTVIEVLENVRSGHVTVPTEYDPGGSESGQEPAKASGDAGTSSELPHCPGGRVPGALSAVTMKALSMKPAARYLSVSRLSAEIDSFQHGHATTAEDISPLGELLLLIKRNKAVAIATAIAFVIINAVVFGFMIKVNADKENAIALKEDAVEKEAETRQALARSFISLSEAGLRERDSKMMKEALEKVPDDLRGADWEYMNLQADDRIAAISLPDIKAIPLKAVPHPLLPHVFVVPINHQKIALLNVRTGERLKEFDPGFSPCITTVTVSPDGQRIAAGSRGAKGGIVILDSKTGERLQKLDAHLTEFLSFSPDGRLLIQAKQQQRITARQNPVSAWDLSTGREIWTGGKTRQIPWICLTPDGSKVVLCPPYGEFQILSIKNGRTIASHANGAVTRFVMHPGGRNLLGASREGELLLLGLDGERNLLRTLEQVEMTEHMAFSADGDWFVTHARRQDGQHLIQVRTAKSGWVRHSLMGGSGYVASLALHPLSGELVTSYEKVMHVWDCRQASLTLDGIVAGTFHNSDHQFLGQAKGGVSKQFGLKGPSLAMFDLRSKRPVVLWSNRAGSNGSTGTKQIGPTDSRPVINKDGTRAIAWSRIAGDDSLSFNLDGTNWNSAGWFRSAPGFPIRFTRINPQGTRVIPVPDPYRAPLIVYEFKGGSKVLQLEQKKAFRTHDLRWSPDGKEVIGLVSEGHDRGTKGHSEIIRVWDPETGTVLRELPHDSLMDVLDISPSGDRFAEAGTDGRVRIRDMKTLEVLEEFRVHNSPVTGLAWHPTKPIIATASMELGIRLWDLDSEKRLAELFGADIAPSFLEFSPTGKRLACKGRNATHIWNLDERMNQAKPASIFIESKPLN